MAISGYLHPVELEETADVTTRVTRVWFVIVGGGRLAGPFASAEKAAVVLEDEGILLLHASLDVSRTCRLRSKARCIAKHPDDASFSVWELQIGDDVLVYFVIAQGGPLLALFGTSRSAWNALVRLHGILSRAWGRRPQEVEQPTFR